MKIRNTPILAFVDNGSSCTTITESVAKSLGLEIDRSRRALITGYGQGEATSLGTTEEICIEVDDVNGSICAVVVHDNTVGQDTPIILGRDFIDLPHIYLLKGPDYLKFSEYVPPDLPPPVGSTQVTKVKFRASSDFTIPAGHLGHIPVETDHIGDVFIQACVRNYNRCELYIPNTIITCSERGTPVIPCLNLSTQEASFTKGKTVARGWTCNEDTNSTETMRRITHTDNLEPLDEASVNIGDVPLDIRNRLIALLDKYRDCIALSTRELGNARTGEIQIKLHDETPFSYRPYRMSHSEQEELKVIVDELLKAEIVRESNSAFASPVLLVGKKNGEKRLCIDYRKLNTQTVKDSHPLPRIDDQVDRLADGVYFCSLDLKSGYYQVPVEEDSRQYTSFVTPNGQFEFLRMPFGLTNAPRVFQRYMNRVLAPSHSFAAIYLDDILTHAPDLETALADLEKLLGLLREEGLTLNLKKCAFLQTTVNFLGFQISAGRVKPGADKIKAVENFPTPLTPHHIRQFLGLTGYFRHFIENYARIAKPITLLLRKNQHWLWAEPQVQAFTKLKRALVERPTLAIYRPTAPTEVHTDASAVGLGGILLQRHEDEKKLHPVAYFSRQTQGAESKYHSYELETLAVVESLKKFRIYLIGVHFKVYTDCNSLKMSASKKQLIPRIARWWLQLLEYNFDIEYRPGQRMQHVDALSRNPSTPTPVQTIMKIDVCVDDWVLAGQLTDAKLARIKTLLEKPNPTQSEIIERKDYVLKEGRIYRNTVNGPVWVVPKGMRHEIVHIAHEAVGHCSIEKTMKKIREAYWFPRMQTYVEQFIKCCIPCLYAKRKGGKPEGLLHPIPKGKIPLETLHIDHLGPFPRSTRRNQHLVVGVDSFTKFAFLKAVRNTQSKWVIEYLRDIFATYGTPKVIISDRGSSFTSSLFKSFCAQNGVKPLLNAVATPRANGQVERLNRVIMNALLADSHPENRWDDYVRQLQFAINSTENKSTGSSPAMLMFGYIPRGGGDMLLRDEVQEVRYSLDRLHEMRLEASINNERAQMQQKKYYDRRHRQAQVYKPGDLVVMEKQTTASGGPGTSRKLIRPYQGPMKVLEVLGKDRYRIGDIMGGRTRSKRRYEQVVSADKLKLWSTPGLSEEENEEDEPMDDDEESPRDEA